MSKITRIGPKGLALIKSFEGFYPKPYLCPAKVPTIGYGTTYYENGHKVTLQDQPLTEVQASSLLERQLVNYATAVDSYTTDAINQQQFDALVSFAYNVGTNALKNSTLLKKVNANPNDLAIKKEFLKWVNAGGRKLAGLVRRREAEANLYFS